MVSDEQARAALDAALAGDQYDWLIEVLQQPAAIECPQCGDSLQPVFGSVVHNHPPCHAYPPPE
jgi:hypothetical protein